MKNTTKTEILVLIISFLVAAVGIFIVLMLPDNVFSCLTAAVSGVVFGRVSVWLGRKIVDWIVVNG